jgi:hypothetical protein
MADPRGGRGLGSIHVECVPSAEQMVISLTMRCESYWRLSRFGQQVDGITGELNVLGQDLRPVAGAGELHPQRYNVSQTGT